MMYTDNGNYIGNIRVMLIIMNIKNMIMIMTNRLIELVLVVVVIITPATKR